jgi:hypothetical protein
VDVTAVACFSSRDTLEARRRQFCLCCVAVDTLFILVLCVCVCVSLLSFFCSFHQLKSLLLYLFLSSLFHFHILCRTGQLQTFLCVVVRMFFRQPVLRTTYAYLYHVMCIRKRESVSYLLGKVIWVFCGVVWLEKPFDFATVLLSLSVCMRTIAYEHIVF